ncbi:MAG TPA: xanthine dehydrogenase family protein molybdopterin-binding subunit [Vicinamibacterales bacterium]|nr:xanthine dehydrogenase family protein molybdopterin-binding subunit [Vicinamibacterales bacterium]
MSTGLGASVKRREDPEFLRGESKFTADVTLPGMTHVAILHSTEAHARIRGLDMTAASKMPGVIRIFTGADLAGKMMPMVCIWKPADVESHFPPHPYGLPGAQTALATDRVRYFGEWVAAVVAETREQAYAAREAIKVDYEPLPSVTNAEEALKPGAPQLHETVPGNLCATVAYGDKAAVDAAIAKAEVTVKLDLSIPRQLHEPLEPRATIASFDPANEEYTLWTNTQIPHGNRFMICNLVMGIPYNKLRVIVPAIGGSYGSKGYLYQDGPLMLFLAREVGRPVRWVDTREGLSVTTVHSRGQLQHATIAGKRDGTITALSVINYVDLGAYPASNGPGAPLALTGRSVTGAYAIPNPYYEAHLVFANTVSLGPARGAGRMEAMLLIERMVDAFAREIGMSPVDVRRKNMVKPDQFPYDNRLGWTYDSGNYEAALDRALQMAGYANLESRRQEARKRGKRLGMGIGSYVCVAGVGPSPRMGREGLIGSTWASAVVRVHQTGDVSVVTGSQPHGQGQQTTFSQIINNELGVANERVEVMHSDTHGVPFGQGSYGSRTFSVEGAAIYQAAQVIKQKAIKVGAYMLKASEQDIVFENGSVSLKSDPAQSKSVQDIASFLWFAWDLPPGVEPGLEATAYFNPSDFNFPFGTHVATVEVDEQTGHVDLTGYVAVDDVGEAGNPMVVEGQMQGSIAFGIGPALTEAVRYDESGRLLTRDFRTYGMPRASQMPEFKLERTVTPTPINPMGAKGAGDVSQPAVAPAIINAICDALADQGVRHLDIPATPEKVWRAMQS